METKFDAVMSPDISKIQPEGSIRRGNCKFPISRTAQSNLERHKRSQFLSRTFECGKEIEPMETPYKVAIDFVSGVTTSESDLRSHDFVWLPDVPEKGRSV